MSVKCTHTYSKMSSIHRHWIADAQHIFSYQKGGSGEERTIHSHIKSVLDLETFHFLLNPLVPPQTWLMIGFLQRLNTRPLVAGLCTHEARSDQQPDRHTDTQADTQTPTLDTTTVENQLPGSLPISIFSQNLCSFTWSNFFVLTSWRSFT